MTCWHARSVADAARELGVDLTQGLSHVEAGRRLAQVGPNELLERGTKRPWRILWEQLTSTMVVILLVAAVASAAMGDLTDAVVILAILFLNALLGLAQEYRAEKAMAALKRLAVPHVQVLRDGAWGECSARAVVPGDVVRVEAGGRVPADARVIESASLRVQEAALTGESEPIEKVVGALSAESLPLGDRRSMIYLGTEVVFGRGQALVVGTGMSTELGRIAGLLQSVAREPTPLQKRMDQLGRRLAAAAVGLVGIIFVTGLLRGQDFKLMFLTAVSMAVAAIPEGLPAVVTIALALGAQRMLRRRALIRKLPAVETLGSVTIICSDKTGTLTQNRMTVSGLEVAGQRLDLDAPTGEARALVLAAGALCNDALLQTGSGTADGPAALGDPTEIALLVAAERFGLRKVDLERPLPRVAEWPFDAQRKRMTTLHAIDARTTDRAALRALVGVLGPVGGAGWCAVTKGAADGLVERASHVWDGEQVLALDAGGRSRIAAAQAGYARQGMRVLGVALRHWPERPASAGPEEVERDLIFLGLVAMIDPPRVEAAQAVATCRRAGIRPIMITGDHPLTASHIARALGIARDDRVLVGAEVEDLAPDALRAAAAEVSVFARVSPEHKLRIVQALQAGGQVVAMTGDGVNDAPALKQADIGVAMGITGTDVSKESADMVLQDDNFATIVAAVAEGRVIYDNIRKFIRYLLATNAAELWVMLLAPVVGLPLPLLPLQILWMNLVTDGLPALALGVEPAERQAMQRKPRPVREGILARGLGWYVVWMGLFMAVVSLWLGRHFWALGQAHWQSMLFTTLTLTQLANVLALRSERESFFTIGPLTNLPMLLAVGATAVLQVLLLYVPALQALFKTQPLTVPELALCLGLASLSFWVVEAAKWVRRRKPVS